MINTIFLFFSAFLFIVQLFLDMKRTRKQPKSIKQLYFTLYAFAGCLLLGLILGFKPLMPTRFFLNHVSPWVFTLIYS
jgi:hypothetical protein